MAKGTFKSCLLLSIVLLLIKRGKCQEDTKGTPDIERLLREGDSQTNLDGYDEVIVLVGGTGTGKSTLSKYLRKHPTLKILNKSRRRGRNYIFVDNEDKIGSKSSHTSKTFYPNIDEDPETGFLIIDLAGFQDTREPEFDLVAGFLNKKILDSAKRFKIILVENYANLQSNVNRAAFTTTLRHLSKLIGGNIASFNNSIGIVATKVDSTSDDASILDLIDEFVQDTMDYLLEEKQKALENGHLVNSVELSWQIMILESIIASDESKIAIFRKPSSLGDPWEVEPLKNNFQQMRYLIFEQLEFSLPLTDKFHVTVDHKTVNFINENILKNTSVQEHVLFQELSSALQISFRQTVDVDLRPIESKVAAVTKYCLEYKEALGAIKSFDQFESFVTRKGVNKTILDELRFQFSKARFLYEVVGKDFSEITEKLSNSFGWKESILVEVNSFLNFQQFLKALSAEFELNQASLHQRYAFRNISIVDDDYKFKILGTNLRVLGFSESTSLLASNLRPTDVNLKDLRNLATERTSKIGDSGPFTGNYIFLSQIKTTIMTKLPLNEVVIMATHKLFIDTDLELQHTHLVLVAPEIEIVQTVRTIKLTGEDGAQIQQAKKSDKKEENGINGLQGNPGYSSGSFKMFTLDVKNADLLIVETYGGNGGDGQKGGDGFDGITSPVPQEPDFHITGLSVCHILEKLKYECTISQNFFLYILGRYTITIKNYQESAVPTNGGKGGAGGFGAVAGSQDFFVQNKFSIETAKKLKIDGHPGVPGSGGLPGVNRPLCSVIEYDCSLAELPKYMYACRDGEHYSCVKYPRAAVNGQTGDNSSIQIVYKYLDRSELFYVILNLSKCALKEDKYFSQTKNLLDYLFEGFANTFTIKHYLKFLQNSEVFSFPNLVMSNLNYLYHKMYASFKTFQRECSSCIKAYTKTFDLMFVSRLDYLETFTQSKQVVKLASKISTKLQQLSRAETAIQEFGKLETIENETEKLQSVMAKARIFISEKHEKQFEQLNRDVDVNLEVLVSKCVEFQNEYNANIENLEVMKDELSAEMKKKAMLGVVSIFSTIGSIIYPPSAAIGSAITAFSGGSSTGKDVNKFKPNIPKGVQNAKSILKAWEESKGREKNLKMSKSIAVMQEVIGAESAVGSFLSKENRQDINKFLGDQKSTFSHDGDAAAIIILDKSNAIFDAVISDLDTKVLNLQQTSGAGEKIEQLNLVKGSLTDAKGIVSVIGTAAKVMNEYSNDKKKLKIIKEVIESNNVALREMANYEENIYLEFKPMLSDMIDSFDHLKSDLANQNAIMLQFQKHDIKKFARKCISLINKFTQDFVEKDDGLSSVFFELQDFMTTMVDAYDKINELQYRVELIDFLGQITSNQCSQNLTSDPEDCKLYLKSAAEIKVSDAVREFVHIYRAYQQVLFPFGEEKMQVLQSTTSKVIGKPELTTQEVIVTLRTALETMQTDLSETNEAITNHKDLNIFISDFNSKYVSSDPFYVWPNSKYGEQIKALLNGEQITLSASVLTPGVKNAVKFRQASLNFTSRDHRVVTEMQDLLRSFELEMIHGGESYYRCGKYYYAIGGDELNFLTTFERNEKGELVSRNKVFEKLNYGDVPLSPYTIWKFKLVHVSSKTDSELLKKKLARLADKVDLELIGEGFYIRDGAAICDTDLGKFYDSFSNGIF